MKRRKVAVWVAVWALAVTVMAFATPSVTVREQTEVADALPDLHAAMGDAAGLLTGKPYAFVVGSLEPEPECSVTPVRAGEQYSRTLTVYADEADVETVAMDLAAGLQDRYGLERLQHSQAPRFSGEIDSYVLLDLVVQGNTVTWTAGTGCRPVGDAVAEVRPGYQPPAAAVDALAELTGEESADWRLSGALCGDLDGPGGATRTATAEAPLPEGAVADVSYAAEWEPDGASTLVESTELVAYRLGDTSTVIELDDRLVTVSTTVDCGAR